jgi:hypothetical protein
MGPLDPKPMGRKSKSCYVGGRWRKHVLHASVAVSAGYTIAVRFK